MKTIGPNIITNESTSVTKNVNWKLAGQTKPYEYSFGHIRVYTVDRCMESPYTWPRHSWVPFALILGAISIRPNYPQTNHNVENTYTPQQRIVCFSIADIQHPFIPLFYVLASRFIRFFGVRQQQQQQKQQCWMRCSSLRFPVIFIYLI